MTKPEGHTALPWRTSLPDSTLVIGRDGDDVTRMDGDYETDYARMEADAALIVRAVNAHDALVEVAQYAAELFEGSNSPLERMAIAALSRAKEQTP